MSRAQEAWSVRHAFGTSAMGASGSGCHHPHDEATLNRTSMNHATTSNKMIPTTASRVLFARPLIATSLSRSGTVPGQASRRDQQSSW